MKSIKQKKNKENVNYPHIWIALEHCLDCLCLSLNVPKNKKKSLKPKTFKKSYDKLQGESSKNVIISAWC